MTDSVLTVRTDGSPACIHRIAVGVGAWELTLRVAHSRVGWRPTFDYTVALDRPEASHD